jgi:PadR family transcriptional regulator, regulatory protein PadR
MQGSTSAHRFRKSLNGGTGSLVMLAILAGSPEDLYGYDIARRIALANGGTSIFRDGTIYPVLRSLAAEGLLSSRIVPSYGGPPRRYYRITPAGREALAEWQAVWRETRELVERFVS